MNTAEVVDMAARTVQRALRERAFLKTRRSEVWGQRMVTLTAIAAAVHIMRESDRLMLSDLSFTCFFFSGVDEGSCRSDSLAFISRLLMSSEAILNQFAYFFSVAVLLAFAAIVVAVIFQFLQPQILKLATTDLLSLATTDDAHRSARSAPVELEITVTRTEEDNYDEDDDDQMSAIPGDEMDPGHVERALGFRRKVGNRRKVVLKRQTSLLMRTLKPTQARKSWGPTEIQGFLLKKSSGGIFPRASTFQRRYFIASDHFLRYYLRSDKTTEDDLRASIDLDRVEVESPNGDTVTLRLDGGTVQLKAASEVSAAENAKIAFAWYESLTKLQWQSQFRHGSRLERDDK